MTATLCVLVGLTTQLPCCSGSGPAPVETLVHAPGLPGRRARVRPRRAAGWQTVDMSRLAGTDVQALLADAAGRAGRYLAALDTRPVAPDDTALAGLARFNEPLPEVTGDPATTLALLDEAGSAAVALARHSPVPIVVVP